MKLLKNISIIFILFQMLFACSKNSTTDSSTTSATAKVLSYKLSISDSFIMPEESKPHEGTWLQWPHQYQYGLSYRNALDATWIAMTKALYTGEVVHIIAYDNTESDRIKSLLTTNGIALPNSNIDINIFQTDDVWVRDNGPIFVKNKKDTNANYQILDFSFNGWGLKSFSGKAITYSKCDVIPKSIGDSKNFKTQDLNSVIVSEGGAFTIDGAGTFMATKSSTINSNRNPGMTQEQAENIYKQTLGVTNFIWLDGFVSKGEITDMHIDGFATFVDNLNIITMSDADLLKWLVPASDISKLKTVKNKNGQPYILTIVPLTKNNVSTTAGKSLGYQGSYVNYYIANKVVLVPNYNDPNDAVANQIIQKLYPTRTVVGIDVRNLYESGGMVHCVTQQQPK